MTAQQHHTYTKDFLNQIIQIQSCLTAAEFDLDAFMQLVAEQIHQLTPVVILRFLNAVFKKIFSLSSTKCLSLGIQYPADKPRDNTT